MLDERAANLFKLILASPIITMRQLEIQTHSSRRQVNYDLQKINDWLLEQDLPPISNKRAHGLLVHAKVKNAGITLLPNVKVQDYTPSHEVRTCMILVQVFIKSKYLLL